MTFEELQTIAKEQETRIFSLACTMNYAASKNFNRNHFNDLHRNNIHNTCWEVLLKLKFPFESITPSVEYCNAVKDNAENPDAFSSISFKFSLHILNEPSLTILDLAMLVGHFLTYFDDTLTQFYKLPMEIQNSSMLFEMSRNHSLYKANINDKSF